jgi:hypothetical protein
MARKKPVSVVGALEHAISDVANAVTVAATGSEIGVLELAAEDELKASRKRPARRARSKTRKKRADQKRKTSGKKKPVRKRKR